MTKLTFKEVILFLTLMKKRITDIEEVINAHFNLVKKVILKEKNDKLYRAKEKDDREQKKMGGSGKPATGRGGTTRKSAASGGKGKGKKDEDVDRDFEEADARKIIRE